MWLKRWWSNFNQLACKCGSKEMESVDNDYINHTLCEFTEVCVKCGRTINYWAYGNYEYPTTKTEWLGLNWFRFKWWIYRKFRRTPKGWGKF